VGEGGGGGGRRGWERVRHTSFIGAVVASIGIGVIEEEGSQKRAG